MDNLGDTPKVILLRVGMSNIYHKGICNLEKEYIVMDDMVQH